MNIVQWNVDDHMTEVYDTKYGVFFWSPKKFLDTEIEESQVHHDVDELRRLYRIEKYLIYSASQCLEVFSWAKSHTPTKYYAIYILNYSSLETPISWQFIYGNPFPYPLILGDDYATSFHMPTNMEEFLEP